MTVEESHTDLKLIEFHCIPGDLFKKYFSVQAA